MSLNIREAALVLGVSENRLRKAIASGRLAVERKGRQILIHETELKAFAERDPGLADGDRGIAGGPDLALTAPSLAVLDGIAARLTALERQLADKWERVDENQRLHERLHHQDRQLATQELELERLRRDLLYQQRLAAKEIEDQRQACEERLTRMEQEAAATIARERDQAEAALAQERQRWSEKLAQQEQAWSEKLAQEQERFARMLTATRNQEGFWARLVRMITWS